MTRVRLAVLFVMLSSISFAGGKGSKSKRNGNANMQVQESESTLEVNQDGLPPFENSIAEAIEAIMDNDREPLYVKTIMGIFSKKLAKFYVDEEIDTPRKRLAFFLSIVALRSFSTFDEKSEYVKDAKRAAEDALKEANETAIKTLERKAWSNPALLALSPFLNDNKKCLEVWKTLRDLDYGIRPKSNVIVYVDAKAAALAALDKGLYVPYVGKVTYEIANLHALYLLVENAEKILRQVYKKALNHLEPTLEVLAINPLRDADAWIPFRKKDFDVLSPRELVFLPWIEILNSHILAASNFELGWQDDQSAIHVLPVDVMKYILALTIVVPGRSIRSW